MHVPQLPQLISSRDNAWFKALRRLAQDSTGYRKTGRCWVEGDHLCRAAVLRGVVPLEAVFAQSYWDGLGVEFSAVAARNVVLPDAVFDELSGLVSPARVGFVLAVPDGVEMAPRARSLILDRVQDAGNVGSMLRSAAAFGFTQVLALKGTAALWSPKVLRAGMGAHFGLHLCEGLDLSALDGLAVPLVVTSSHRGSLVQQLELPDPCAWAMGHEGQGVSPELMARAQAFARIDQPGGEESLNVAAAAAICLYASVVSRKQ